MKMCHKKVIQSMLIHMLELEGYTIHHINLENYDNDLEEGTFYFTSCVEKDEVVYDKDFTVSDATFIAHRREMR